MPSQLGTIMEFDSNKSYTPEQIAAKMLTSKRLKSGLRAEELREQMNPQVIMQALLDLTDEADGTKIKNLPRLKFKADIYTTLLKKCMPDLRSLEIKESSSAKSSLTINVGRSKIDV